MQVSAAADGAARHAVSRPCVVHKGGRSDPFARYIRLSNRLNNRLNNRLHRVNN